MRISETLKKTILEHENEIDMHQFESIYSECKHESDVRTFTEMMLSIYIYQAEYLEYIPTTIYMTPK